MEEQRILDLIHAPEKMTTDDLSSLEEICRTMPYFQAAHILFLKGINQLQPERFTSELQKHTIYINDRKLLYKFLHNLYRPFSEKIKEKQGDLPLSQIPYSLVDDEVEENQQLSLNQERQQKIIDKFIHDLKKTARPQPPVQEPAGNAAKADKQSESLFSETLAEIYIRQKLYDKAIATYNKLSLKYPEKSVYFASRIEKITEIKNNNKTLCTK